MLCRTGDSEELMTIWISSWVLLIRNVHLEFFLNSIYLVPKFNFRLEIDGEGNLNKPFFMSLVQQDILTRISFETNFYTYSSILDKYCEIEICIYKFKKKVYYVMALRDTVLPCRNTLFYAHTTSRTLNTCDISVDLLTVTVPEAGDHVESLKPGKATSNFISMASVKQCSRWQ